MSSFYRDDEKKRCGFIVFVIESAATSRGIPNNYVGKLFHIRSKGPFFMYHHLEARSAFMAIEAYVSWWQQQDVYTFVHTFASKFIRIRAFHNAISRSCVLFNTSRRRQR